MGIIRNLLRRKRVEGHRPSALAMPLFTHSSPPEIDAAVAWVRERFADVPPIGQPEGSEHTYTMGIPGGQLGVTHVPAPVPRGDLEGPIALAWHWPLASSVVATHVAHEICFASSSQLSTIELRLLHSRVIAGLAATGKAAAVYVGSARLVKDGDAYVSEIQDASVENLPLLSWLGFNPVTEGTTLSAYTSGLHDFGLLELEVRNSKRDWGELFDFLANIAHYELTTGVQIGDGETLGGSETERFMVRHTASRFIPETKVACLAA